MKPRLEFYSDGEYSGVHHGDLSDLDEYNCYMYTLNQPNFCLFRFNRDPPIYKWVFQQDHI